MEYFDDEQKRILQAEDLERILLGTILKDSTSNKLLEVIEVIKPTDFSNSTHSMVYSLISSNLMEKNNKILDSNIIASQLQDEQIRQYVRNLGSSSDYETRDLNGIVEKITDLSRLRGLQKLSEQLNSDVIYGKDNSETLIAEYNDKLFNLTSSSTQTFSTMSELYDEQMKFLSDKNLKLGTKTCIKSLDNLIGSMGTGNFVLIAGRPSQGKSLLVLQILIENALNGVRSAFFSVEMPKITVAWRTTANVCRIPLNHIKDRRLTNNELEFLKDNADKIRKLPIIVDDKSGLTPQELVSRAHKLKIQYPDLELATIDYIQLMNCLSIQGGREREIGYVSNIMKQLAKDLGITIIGVSQLSRACEQRENKRPILSDLRDSGSLEQDADLIIFVYRDSYYTRDPEDKSVELLVAKHRNGPIGVVKCEAYMDIQRFEELK